QPGVRTAVVVGAANDVLGECPVAYIVPEDDWPDEKVEAGVRDACQADLPRHKQPVAFYLVGELPLGPTGKVARRRVKDLGTARRWPGPFRPPVRTRPSPSRKRRPPSPGRHRPGRPEVPGRMSSPSTLSA